MFTINSYFSLGYLLLFLPVSAGLYAILPQKLRRWVLLSSSCLFFWAISGKLIAYLAFSVFSIHHIGVWLSSIQLDCDRILETAPKEERKTIRAKYLRQQRGVVAFGVAVHIGLLLVLKYTPFFAENINTLFLLLHIPVTFEIPSFVLPIGISFYTLQAVSYIFDVYRRKIRADRNLLRLALFMSFFPRSWKARSAAIPIRPNSFGRRPESAMKTSCLAPSGFSSA